jgi:hypothetical protein
LVPEPPPPRVFIPFESGFVIWVVVPKPLLLVPVPLSVTVPPPPPAALDGRVRRKGEIARIRSDSVVWKILWLAGFSFICFVLNCWFEKQKKAQTLGGLGGFTDLDKHFFWLLFL